MSIVIINPIEGDETIVQMPPKSCVYDLLNRVMEIFRVKEEEFTLEYIEEGETIELSFKLDDNTDTGCELMYCSRQSWPKAMTLRYSNQPITSWNLVLLTLETVFTPEEHTASCVLYFACKGKKYQMKLEHRGSEVHTSVTEVDVDADALALTLEKCQGNIPVKILTYYVNEFNDRIPIHVSSLEDLQDGRIGGDIKHSETNEWLLSWTTRNHMEPCEKTSKKEGYFSCGGLKMQKAALE